MDPSGIEDITSRQSPNKRSTDTILLSFEFVACFEVNVCTTMNTEPEFLGAFLTKYIGVCADEIQVLLAVPTLGFRHTSPSNTGLVVKADDAFLLFFSRFLVRVSHDVFGPFDHINMCYGLV